MGTTRRARHAPALQTQASTVPGYFRFATSGGREMFARSPTCEAICLAFVAMSANEELPIADSWSNFEGMLKNAL